MKAATPTLSGDCREYRKRWFMLAMFVLCTCSNAMHWVQYSIISNITTRYYGVSSTAINWTAVVFEACYIPLVFPVSWVLDRYVSKDHSIPF
jgi:FLVCR family feline leukemia virus subgroup C receptor-related protein